MVERYTTVARAAQARIEVKRSVFLTTVEPVENEPDARAVVARLRGEHWEARHHCSAFILGPTGQLQRSSDDGEPAGTAGAPMLEVLSGAGLTNVVAVVTRWFGGTLLGAGGLVRAYSDAVRAGLEAAGRLERHRLLHFEVGIPTSTAGRVEAELRSRGWLVLSTQWAQHVVMVLGVPAAGIEEFHRDVAALTAGIAEPHHVGESWS